MPSASTIAQHQKRYALFRGSADAFNVPEVWQDNFQRSPTLIASSVVDTQPAFIDPSRARRSYVNHASLSGWSLAALLGLAFAGRSAGARRRLFSTVCHVFERRFLNGQSFAVATKKIFAQTLFEARGIWGMRSHRPDPIEDIYVGSALTPRAPEGKAKLKLHFLSPDLKWKNIAHFWEYLGIRHESTGYDRLPGGDSFDFCNLVGLNARGSFSRRLLKMLNIHSLGRTKNFIALEDGQVVGGGRALYGQLGTSPKDGVVLPAMADQVSAPGYKVNMYDYANLQQGWLAGYQHLVRMFGAGFVTPDKTLIENSAVAVSREMRGYDASTPLQVQILKSVPWHMLVGKCTSKNKTSIDATLKAGGVGVFDLRHVTRTAVGLDPEPVHLLPRVAIRKKCAPGVKQATQNMFRQSHTVRYEHALSDWRNGFVASLDRALTNGVNALEARAGKRLPEMTPEELSVHGPVVGRFQYSGVCKTTRQNFHYNFDIEFRFADVQDLLSRNSDDFIAHKADVTTGLQRFRELPDDFIARKQSIVMNPFGRAFRKRLANHVNREVLSEQDRMAKMRNMVS